MSPSPPAHRRERGGVPSKLEPRLPGRVGERLHPAVEAVSVAVEGHRLDPQPLGPLGDRLADDLRRGPVAPLVPRLLPEVLRLGGAGGQRHASTVVDELAGDVLVAAEDGQPRLLGRSEDLPSDVQLPPDLPRLLALLLGHDLFCRTEGLAGLLDDPLVLVPDPLALVRLGGPDLADPRRELADLLLVDA